MRHGSTFLVIELVAFLAKGARVMSTMNLWASVGLCNGATGTFVEMCKVQCRLAPSLSLILLCKVFGFGKFLQSYRGRVKMRASKN